MDLDFSSGTVNLIDVLKEALSENLHSTAKLFYFGKKQTFHYCGKCKVTVDGVEQTINVESEGMLFCV